MFCNMKRLAAFGCALLLAGTSWAQPAGPANGPSGDDASREDIEEFVVRGRKPRELRTALEAARVRVYEVFNALNSDDRFDVRCRHEAATGRRMRKHICRPRFQDEISAAAAEAFMYALKEVCPADMAGQECLFRRKFAASLALERAQAEEVRAGPLQELFVLEFERIALEHPELQQAMLEYEVVEQALQESLRRRRQR